MLLAETLAGALRPAPVEPKHPARVTVDTTVQPKALAYPTDSKPLRLAIEILGRLARRHGIALRRSYICLAQRARREAAPLIHRGRHREAERVVRHMRTWLGCLARDIARKVAGAAGRSPLPSRLTSSRACCASSESRGRDKL